MSYPTVNKNVTGKDFNFFERADITSPIFQDHPDMFITFSTNGILFLNEGSGTVEFSFNGNTVHGSLNSNDSSKGVAYDNRVVSAIWFRNISGGTITVRVEAW